MRYRAIVELDAGEGEDQLTPGAIARQMGAEDPHPPYDIRGVDLFQIKPSLEGDRVRALLIAQHRGDLAARVWENSVGDATVPWADGQAPVDAEEVRIVLNVVREARGLSGGASDHEVRDYLVHWSSLCAKRTGGPIVRDGE